MHNIYKIPASVQMENIFVQIGNIFVEITKVYLSKFDMQAPRAGCNLRPAAFLGFNQLGKVEEVM